MFGQYHPGDRCLGNICPGDISLGNIVKVKDAWVVILVQVIDALVIFAQVTDAQQNMSRLQMIGQYLSQ